MGYSIRSILGQIVRQSIISLCYKPANFPPQKINISISRKMLTTIFEQLEQSVQTKNIYKKLLKFITSKWERLNKSEPTLLIICCNIKSCLDLLPKSQTLQI